MLAKKLMFCNKHSDLRNKPTIGEQALQPCIPLFAGGAGNRFASSYGVHQDLDLTSVEVLETALSGFDGALVAVSHDPSFLQAIGVEREIRL